MEEINHIKSRIDQEIGSHFDLPKVIVLGETGAGKTQLLYTLADISPKNIPKSTEPFNFIVEPRQRFTLWDFTSIAKKEIISSIIDYLFQKSPDSENKVTVLLAVPQSDIQKNFGPLIQNIKNAQNMFGKYCQLASRFGIVLTKCTDDPITLCHKFSNQLEDLPNSMKYDIKDYFDHFFIMPYMNEDMYDFEDKKRLISFILDKYINGKYILKPLIVEMIKCSVVETRNSEDSESTNSDYKEKIFLCKSCHKLVKTFDCVYYSGQPYHKSCIKCSNPECDKRFNDEENINDYICITPGLFLCKQHYNEYLKTNKLDDKVAIKYIKKKKENFVDEIFNPPSFKNEDTRNYSKKELLITPDIEEETIDKKPYEDFLPTITLHFDKDAQDINYDKLQKLLGKDVAILNVDRGSTIVKIALLSIEEFDIDAINEKHNQFIEELKEKIHPTVDGKTVLNPVVGNLVEEPIITLPDDAKINEIFNKPSINHLQNTIELDEFDIEEIKQKVLENLKNDNSKRNWNFIFTHEDLYDELQKQIEKDIRDNPYEMIIVGQTIIATRFLDEYNQIKENIPENNITERFLYHGSKLENHQKIVNTHFKMPDELISDGNERPKDPGYYGKGIYATDNIYYASMYSNNCHPLEINQKAYVICCKSIYDKTKVNTLKDLSSCGQPMREDIVSNYGINQAFVGDSRDYFPIEDAEIRQSKIYANEYVFGNKYQFIPCYSFTVMRKDHYILWKDENITNNENSSYMNDLSKHLEFNFYHFDNIDDSINLIEKKRFAAVKLITNGGGLKEKTGKKLIERAREIVGSNFVCLVFGRDLNHMKWISEMENVLFASVDKYFKKFAQLKMNLPELLDFINEIKPIYETNKYKFKINEEQLLYFPRVLGIEREKSKCSVM